MVRFVWPAAWPPDIKMDIQIVSVANKNSAWTNAKFCARMWLIRPYMTI
jgi:hypothetical protein